MTIRRSAVALLLLALYVAPLWRIELVSPVWPRSFN